MFRLSAQAPWEAIRGRIPEELWCNEWQRQTLYPETAREHLHGQSGPTNETRWARTVPQPLQLWSVSILVMKRPQRQNCVRKENKHQFKLGLNAVYLTLNLLKVSLFLHKYDQLWSDFHTWVYNQVWVWQALLYFMKRNLSLHSLSLILSTQICRSLPWLKQKGFIHRDLLQNNF